jgi:hypothetical protein
MSTARWGRRTHARERSADGPAGQVVGWPGGAMRRSKLMREPRELIPKQTPCTNYTSVVNLWLDKWRIAAPTNWPRAAKI